MNLPNKLTLLRFILIPFILFCMLPPHILGVHALLASGLGVLLAWFLFSVASLTDFFDGHLARKYNIVSNFGKLLDPIADKVLILSVWIAFVQLGYIHAIWPIVIMLREFLVTGIRLLALEQGRVIAASISGKMKTVLQITASSFLFLRLALDSTLFASWVSPSIYSIIVLLVQLFVLLAMLATLASGLEYFWKNRYLIK